MNQIKPDKFALPNFCHFKSLGSILLEDIPPGNGASFTEKIFLSGCIHENIMLCIFLRNVEVCEIV